MRKSVGGRKKKHGGFLGLIPMVGTLGAVINPAKQGLERQLEQTMKRKAADMAADKVRNKIMGIKG